MHVVIYGTGGVGGYFGARLAQAGNKVTFIARGKHLEAIQKKGLQLKSPKGDYLVYPANATATVSEIENIDLILVCVKTYQLNQVAKGLKGKVQNDAAVIPLLNGVDNAAILGTIIGEQHVLCGLCKVVSKVEDYGVIRHMSYEPTIVFGELNNVHSKRALAIENLFQKAGVQVKLTNDIQREVWTKFLYISTISALGALTRATIGEMLAHEEIRAMMVQTAEEIVAIARAKGVDFRESIIEKQFEIIESQPYDTTASLQRDMMNGRPSELEAQNGNIVRMGKVLKIATPMNAFIYYSLLPQEIKARKS